MEEGQASQSTKNPATSSSSALNSRQKRSDVWNLFTKKTVDGVETVECKSCKKVLKYVGGTTNMREHWRRSHGGVCERGELEDRGSIRERQLTMGRFIDRTARVCPVWKSEGANQLVVRWLWRNLRPLSIVSDEGLRDLLSFFEPGYRLPSRTYVAGQLRRRHAEARDKLKRLLVGQEGISLTSDIWTSRATQAFNTTTAHFINKEWSLQSFVLATVAFDGHHTGIRIADLLKATTRSFGIPDEDILAEIHDEAANAVLAGRLLEAGASENTSWKSEVCAAHRLQNCIKSALTGIDALDKLLAACRKLVGHFKHSALKTDALLKKQAALSKKPLKPVQDVTTRWNSVFYMLSRLIYLKVALVALFEDDPDFADVTSLLPSSRQWDLIKDLAEVLEVIEVATTQLSGEKYPTMSLVLPLVFGLRSQLAESDDDRCAVALFKRKLREQLTVRFSLDDLDPTSLPVLCTALDPRFRSLSFMDLLDREEAKHKLIELTAKAMTATRCLAADSQPETATCEEPPKKKAKKHREAILDRLFQEDQRSSRDDDAGAVVASFVKEKQVRTFQSWRLMCVWLSLLCISAVEI